MNSSIKYVLHLAGSLFLATTLGCAFGKDNQSANKRDIEDRARLLSSFSIVEGNYVGKMILGNTTQDVELSVFHLDEKSGQYADGTDRYLPVLKASMARVNPASTSLSFGARFVQETGELLLVNSDSSIDVAEVQSLSLGLRSAQLAGDVRSKSGPLGSASFTLSSKQEGNPKDPTEEQNTRLRTEYQQVAGEYTGDIMVGSEKLYSVFLKLLVVDEIGSNGKSKPALRAVYRPDGSGGDGFDNLLQVEYRPDLNPKTIKMVASAQSRYYINIDGTYSAGRIQAKFVDMRGREAALVLTRKVQLK